jgi:hypothetical protein
MEHRKSIKLSTYGLLFFGTPHVGANGAEFQAALTNICHIFVSGNSKLLRHMTGDSDHLQLLSDLYLLISQSFKTIYFYEEYKTPLIGGMAIMVRLKGYCSIVMFVESYDRLCQRPRLLFPVLLELMPFHSTSII